MRSMWQHRALGLVRVALFASLIAGIGCPRSTIPDGGNPDGSAAADGGWEDGGSSDSGSPENDAGLPDASSADSGYAPYVCDGGGSPFDVQRSFLTAEGATDVITICGPKLNGNVVTVAPPSDGGSAYALLAQAISALADAGGTTLALAPGVYDFAGAPARDNWTIANQSDLLIDGQGSTLVFHGYGHGLYVSGSQRILLRNVFIDWSEQLAVGGVAQEADPLCDGGLAFVVGDTWPLDAGTAIPIRWLQTFDVAGRRWLTVPGGSGNWSSVAQSPVFVGNQTYCVPVPDGLLGVDSGTPLVGTSRQGGHAIYVGFGSADVSLENVTVYASPDVAIRVEGTARGARISNSRVMVNPNDSTRLISSCADAVDFWSSRGGVLLEGGDFSGQGDDGLNVSGRFAQVSRVLADDQILAQDVLTGVFGAGDVLEVTDGNTFALLGAVPIASVATMPVPDAGTLLLFSLTDGGIPGLSGWDGGHLSVNVPAASTPDFLVVGNRFHDNRARGAIFASRHGLVTGNVLENNEGLYLHAMDNAASTDGPGTVDVIATGNTLIHNQFDRLPRGLFCGGNLAAPIMVYGASFAATYPPNIPNRDLVISDNVVVGAPSFGISVSSATNVQVQSNSLIDTNQEAFDAGTCGSLGAASGPASLYAANATSVTFSGNVRDGGSAGILIESSCTGCATQSSY
jgi:hypothetical protein